MTGSGKTQAIVTLPRIPLHKEAEPKPLLVLDFDGRSETLAGEPLIEVIQFYDEDPKSPKAWDKAEALRKELWAMARGGNFKFSGVIEDGLTRLAKLAMNSAVTLGPSEKRGLGNAPAMHHWLPQIEYIGGHINSMRMLPCHYLLNGHFDITTEEDSDKIRYLPKITKSLRPELPSWFNETYHSWRKEGKDRVHYYWTTAGTGLYDFFKSTLNNKQKFWKDPIEIDFEKPPVGFEDLIQRRSIDFTECLEKTFNRWCLEQGFDGSIFWREFRNMFEEAMDDYAKEHGIIPVGKH
jgi:hypothetical protein